MEKRVGFGAHKLDLEPGATRDDRIRRARDMLSRVLNLRTAVAFVGAGCSVQLGYPTWTQFASLLVSHAIENCPSGSELKALQRFQAQLEAGPVKPHQIMFILGECRKSFEQNNKMNDYYKFLRTTFKPRPNRLNTLNPYNALLELRIKRFITTNYDREIEIALVKNGLVPREEFGLHRKPGTSSVAHRDFTQESEFNDQLALFALSKVEEADYMVFHCHGHYNRPESLVVTEDDYQRWYLAQERAGAVAFRQTVSLLFGSNPVLFVGYGLGDDDLLGTLRMFNSVEPERKSSRPLFALLPERVEGEDDDDHRFYYERYGVNVIPYQARTAEERSRALFEALQTLKHNWTEWRAGWLQKPRIRKIRIESKPPDAYHHYPMASGTEMPNFGGDRVRNLLEDLRQEAETGTKLIALVGAGGTGKSWHAQQLMEVVQRGGTRFRGFFFWSSYYADDSLTGLDRALCYMGRESGAGSRIDRFEECLRDPAKPCFLVFDGIERFLRPTTNPEEGSAFDPNTSSFLAAMAHKDNHSTVVLTSRLWPEVFNLPQFAESKIRRMRVPLFTTADVEDVPPFRWFENREHVSALCSLLNGHIYGLVLAARMLNAAGKSGAHECLQQIRRALSDTSPHARTSRMIREAIDVIDEEWNGLALKLLERLAVFMRPVTDVTLEICIDSAVREVKLPEGKDPRSLVDVLLCRSLLHRVYGSADRYSYTVHPIVRGYVYQRIHRASTDLIPNFTLPGFTAGTATVDPGSSPESAVVVKDIFDRLQVRAEQARGENESRVARELCRAAFGVVRSRMEANTSPRWTTYDSYLRILVKVGNLAKMLSPSLWDYAERHDIHSVEDKVGPFYADELAWLYNEIGLTCYAEGSMLDAHAVWEQGYEINRVIDSFEEGGRYLFQSLCNLGAVYVHYGHLNTAEIYLREAEQVNYHLGDEDHAGRITGYLGLVQHLRGDLQQADDKYETAVRQLREARNPRAESIFQRHRADLKIQQNDFNAAGCCIQISRSLAEAESYPELIAYSRLSLGHLYRRQEEYAKAQREYNVVYDTGRRIGMRRLQAEALTELSRLAYDLGDAQLASKRAIESLRIANELVLGLRQTHDLVVLGRATIETGQPELGVAYLKHAKKLAERQEYRLRAYETEECLQKYGETATR